MKKIDLVLHEKLEKLISSMGYELIGCEASSQGRQMVFRVFIDRDKGVTVDDCSQVSRQVSAILDVEGTFQGRYVLEVSSPGIDKPLFEIKHFQRSVGCQVKIRLYMPINEKRQYKGLLKRVEGENIHLLIDGYVDEVVLPFDAIEKANVIGEVTL